MVDAILAQNPINEEEYKAGILDYTRAIFQLGQAVSTMEYSINKNYYSLATHNTDTANSIFMKTICKQFTAKPVKLEIDGDARKFYTLDWKRTNTLCTHYNNSTTHSFDIRNIFLEDVPKVSAETPIDAAIISRIWHASRCLMNIKHYAHKNGIDRSYFEQHLQTPSVKTFYKSLDSIIDPTDVECADIRGVHRWSTDKKIEPMIEIAEKKYKKHNEGRETVFYCFSTEYKTSNLTEIHDVFTFDLLPKTLIIQLITHQDEGQEVDLRFHGRTDMLPAYWAELRAHNDPRYNDANWDLLINIQKEVIETMKTSQIAKEIL
jgi:hypothetical protein